MVECEPNVPFLAPHFYSEARPLGGGWRMKPPVPELDPAVPGREREKGVETGSGVCSDLVNVGTYDVLPSSPWRRDLLRGPPRVYELPATTIHPFFLSRAPRH